MSAISAQTGMPLPDPQGFSSEPAPAASAILQTPPSITPSRIGTLSSTIKPSPTIPKPPNDYHSVHGLFKIVKMRDLKSFKGKQRHTVELTSPDKGKILARSFVAAYVSICSKTLIKKSGQKLPPLQVDSDTQVRVPEPDVAVVEKRGTKRKRSYGIHRQGQNASLYPKDGDGVKQFARDCAGTPTPERLLQIVKDYRANPTGDPLAFLRALTP